MHVAPLRGPLLMQPASLPAWPQPLHAPPQPPTYPLIQPASQPPIQPASHPCMHPLHPLTHLHTHPVSQPASHPPLPWCQRPPPRCGSRPRARWSQSPAQHTWGHGQGQAISGFKTEVMGDAGSMKQVTATESSAEGGNGHQYPCSVTSARPPTTHHPPPTLWMSWLRPWVSPFQTRELRKPVGSAAGCWGPASSSDCSWPSVLGLLLPLPTSLHTKQPSKVGT